MVCRFRWLWFSINRYVGLWGNGLLDPYASQETNLVYGDLATGSSSIKKKMNQSGRNA